MNHSRSTLPLGEALPDSPRTALSNRLKKSSISPLAVRWTALVPILAIVHRLETR